MQYNNWLNNFHNFYLNKIASKDNTILYIEWLIAVKGVLYESAN